MISQGVKKSWLYIQFINNWIKKNLKKEHLYLLYLLAFSLFFLGMILLISYTIAFSFSEVDYSHPQIKFKKKVTIDSTLVIVSNYFQNKTTHERYDKKKIITIIPEASYKKLPQKEQDKKASRYLKAKGLDYNTAPTFAFIFYTIGFIILIFLCRSPGFDLGDKVYKTIKDLNELSQGTMVAINLLLLLTVFGFSLIDHSYSNTKTVLEHTIKNKASLDAVISLYKDEYNSNLISSVALVVFVSQVYVFILWVIFISTRGIYKILSNYSKKLWEKCFGIYENTIFNKIWAQRKNQLLKSHIRKHGAAITKAIFQDIPKNEVIEIDHTGFNIIQYEQNGEYNELPSDLKLIPLPNRKTLYRTTLGNFFNIIFGDGFNSFYEVFKKNFTKEYKNTLKTDGLNFAKDISNELFTTVENAFDKIKQNLETKIDGARKEATRLLDYYTNLSIRKFQRTLSKRSQEILNDVLNPFPRSLISNIKNLYKGDDSGLISVQNDILPKNCKYFLSNNEHKIVVIEQEPKKRNCSISAGVSGDNHQREFYLSFPYVVFVITLHEDNVTNIYAYFRKEPINDINDTLYFANFTNMHEDGRMCLGFSGHHEKSFSEKVNEVISYFWSSSFNTDLNSQYNTYKERDSRLDFINWEKETKENPNFIMDVNFMRVNSLAHILKNCIKYQSMRKNDLVMSPIMIDSLYQIIESKKQDLLTELTKALTKIPTKIDPKNNMLNILERYEKELFGNILALVNSEVSNSIDKEKFVEVFQKILLTSSQKSFNDGLKSALNKLSSYEPNLNKITENIKNL